MNHYINAFKNSFNYRGRSSRMEFWMFFLIHISALLVLAYYRPATITFNFALGRLIFILLYIVFSTLAYIALAIRRLHDSEKPGWIVLLTFVPAVGAIFMLFFMCLNGSPGENRYGENPNKNPNIPA